MRIHLEKNRGTTLIETIFYIVILVLVLTVVVNALFSFGRLYRNMQSQRAIEGAAQTALERMTREIRDSISIDTPNGLFNNAHGVLALNTTNSSGGALLISFRLENEAIEYREDGVLIGSLTPTGARVTSLIFRPITTTNSESVKIEMTVESGDGPSYKSRTFYSTVVLRGSYPLL